MVHGVIVLAVLDGICALMAYAAFRSNRAQTVKGFPLSWMLGIALVAAPLHFIGIAAAAREVGMTSAFVVSIGTGFVPAVLLAILVRESVAHRASNFILGDDRDAIPRPEMAAAHAMMRAGNYASALAEYQRLAREYPNAPEPLFGMETLFSQDGRFEDAAAVCRDIARRFTHRETEWTKANRRLAELLREHLDDPTAADMLAKAIDERNPDAKFGYIKLEQKHAVQHAPERKKGDFHGTADLDQARRLAKKGETREAVALFKRHYADSARDPRPLFEAAHALQLAEQFQEALALLQEIARTHDSDEEIWCRATLELASIHEAHFADTVTAESILIQVQRRIPYGEPGRLARERLNRIRGE